MIHRYDHSSRAITVSHPGYYLSDPLLLCSLLCPSDRHHILWQLALKDCKVQYRDQIISGKGAEKDCVSAKPEWLVCNSRAEKMGLHKKKWLYALLKKKTTFLSGAVCYHDSPPAPLVWNHPSSSKCKNTKKYKYGALCTALIKTEWMSQVRLDPLKHYYEECQWNIFHKLFQNSKTLLGWSWCYIPSPHQGGWDDQI